MNTNSPKSNSNENAEAKPDCAPRTGSVDEPTLEEAIKHLKMALDEAGRNMALNTLYHAERAAELAQQVVKHRMSNPPNAEVSEGGTRDSRIETAAQSRPSLH